MSSIGGPGGVGGPKAPGGPEGPEGPDGPDDVRGVAARPAVDRAGAATDLDAMAAEIAAGRMTPQEAVDRLVDEIAGDSELPAADRAELREMLADMVANDPYLQSLVGRVG